MIVHCEKCNANYDDEFRLTYCPHDAFPANDGNNNFKVYEDAFLEYPEDLGVGDGVTEWKSSQEEQTK